MEYKVNIELTMCIGEVRTSSRHCLVTNSTHGGINQSNIIWQRNNIKRKQFFNLFSARERKDKTVRGKWNAFPLLDGFIEKTVSKDLRYISNRLNNIKFNCDEKKMESFLAVIKSSKYGCTWNVCSVLTKRRHCGNAALFQEMPH